MPGGDHGPLLVRHGELEPDQSGVDPSEGEGGDTEGQDQSGAPDTEESTSS